EPKAGDRYVLRNAAQSETRSHGFFFRDDPGPDNSYSGAYGVLGLPVGHPMRPGFAQLFDESAGVVFVRREAGRFNPLGELLSQPDKATADDCVASCVDWYGNARPIFVGERAFALMGYELVEGRITGTSIEETGRVNVSSTIRRRERS